MREIARNSCDKLIVKYSQDNIILHFTDMKKEI